MSAAGRVEDRGETPDAPPSRRRWDRQDPTGPPIHLNFAQCAEILIALRAAGVPWWADCLTIAFVASAGWLRVVFPQESHASSLDAVNDGERGGAVTDLGRATAYLHEL